jgi:hypothetical protein
MENYFSRNGQDPKAGIKTLQSFAKFYKLENQPLNSLLPRFMAEAKKGTPRIGVEHGADPDIIRFAREYQGNLTSDLADAEKYSVPQDQLQKFDKLGKAWGNFKVWLGKSSIWAKLADGLANMLNYITSVDLDERIEKGILAPIRKIRNFYMKFLGLEENHKKRQALDDAVVNDILRHARSDRAKNDIFDKTKIVNPANIEHMTWEDIENYKPPKVIDRRPYAATQRAHSSGAPSINMGGVTFNVTSNKPEEVTRKIETNMDDIMNKIRSKYDMAHPVTVF